MNYSINNFFTKDECKYYLNFCMENGEPFKYNPAEHWDCRRVYDNEFKLKIYNRFQSLHKENKIKFWFDFSKFNVTNINVSLTRYYDGRFLELHSDSTSEFTTVIVLTDDFFDGRFVLTNSYESIEKNPNSKSFTITDLKIGEGISFNGAEIYHGVLPVSSGIRCALNVWMNDMDFNYYKLKNETTLL